MAKERTALEWAYVEYINAKPRDSMAEDIVRFHDFEVIYRLRDMEVANLMYQLKEKETVIKHLLMEH